MKKWLKLFTQKSEKSTLNNGENLPTIFYHSVPVYTLGSGKQ